MEAQDKVERNLHQQSDIETQSSVDSHLYSFFPSTVRLWNSIPISCKSRASLENFKSSLDNITFNNMNPLKGK